MVLDKTLESPSDCKEVKSFSPKGDQPWIFIGRIDAEAEAPILWPPDVKNWLIRKEWCWERLKAGGEGDDRAWDGWMASLTQWTWVWVNSGSWWWTGRPVVLQSMGSQRVGHDWVTELNWCLEFLKIYWHAIFENVISELRSHGYIVVNLPKDGRDQRRTLWRDMKF